MKLIRNEKGFTLVEMLVVMLIISVLLILIIPNVMKQHNSIQNKGCDAYVASVQSQVQAYMLEKDGEMPTVKKLIDGGYIKNEKCTDGSVIKIDNGTVRAEKSD